MRRETNKEEEKEEGEAKEEEEEEVEEENEKEESKEEERVEEFKSINYLNIPAYSTSSADLLPPSPTVIFAPPLLRCCDLLLPSLLRRDERQVNEKPTDSDVTECAKEEEGGGRSQCVPAQSDQAEEGEGRR